MSILPSSSSTVSEPPSHNNIVGSRLIQSEFSMLTGKLETNSRSESYGLNHHQFNHNVRLHRQEIKDDFFPRLLPLFPLSDDHQYSYHGDSIYTKGPDSRRGTQIVDSDSTLDSTDEVQAVSKIRLVEEGPLWNLVHVLRNHWNINSLTGRGTGTGDSPSNHKNQSHINSHKNTNSIESLTALNESIKCTTMTAAPRQYIPQQVDQNQHNHVYQPTKRTTRTRSRAIAIPRPTMIDDEERKEEIRQQSIQAEYDWATWRMYNRIIDHRQKYPIPYVYDDEQEEYASTAATTTETSATPSNITTHFVDDSTNENLDDDDCYPVVQQQQQYYPEYGEVFDLDL